jgi:hypothetical protein
MPMSYRGSKKSFYLVDSLASFVIDISNLLRDKGLAANPLRELFHNRNIFPILSHQPCPADYQSSAMFQDIEHRAL